MTRLTKFRAGCNVMGKGIWNRDRKKVVNLVIEVNKKCPHVLLPEFVEDYNAEIGVTEMMKKYNIHDSIHFDYLVKKVFKQDNHSIDRRGSKYSNRYEVITKECSSIRTPICGLLHDSIRETVFIHAALEEQHAQRGNIAYVVSDVYPKISPLLPLLKIKSIKSSFDHYMGGNLAANSDDIINEIKVEHGLSITDKGTSGSEKHLPAEGALYDLVKKHKKGISYNSIIWEIEERFPLLRMLIGVGKIDELLDKLVNEKKLLRTYDFKRTSSIHDQFFTPENHKALMKTTKEDYKKTNKDPAKIGKDEFFGRKIDPDRFIDELVELEKGDLDDCDDQVARITGLVLSHAALLRSPRETGKKFDFIVDLKDDNFSADHQKLMKNQDFEANKDDIFHCKVMINKKVTIAIIEDLIKSIPSGDKGVIFTCRRVDPSVRQYTHEDRTVQIIDEEGIQGWCHITPTIPCRRHSVARIMCGKEKGSMVLVKSLNYESGQALVEIIPGGIETTFAIGYMQEIDLHVPLDVNFESVSNKYFDIVSMLAKLSDDDFKIGMGLDTSTMHSTHENVQQSTRSKRHGGIDPPVDPMPADGGVPTHIKFKDAHVELRHSSSNSQNCFHCTCDKWSDKTHYHALCSHLTSAINHYCVSPAGWQEINKRIKLMTRELEEFQMNNLQRMTQAVHEALDTNHKKLFARYMRAHAEEDEEGGTDATDAAKIALAIKENLQNEPDTLQLFEKLCEILPSFDGDGLKNVANKLE
ncbi:hypothetical protein CENSYa_0136 [Cenarchaeum symbiosum A]|uniref:SWIM-type domain-containing protein n=1 Tax=Cenarchaeum symbiosum (strain A) TaxID=414004 RepID=A0RTW4_CENSY|nr:hypothetical protein CENSYa_0136 [Cenarchaeum symbiosum A]